eukprot:SAG31_NODE_137_length_23063_cov_5.002569_10_plen_145_part_00
MGQQRPLQLIVEQQSGLDGILRVECRPEDNRFSLAFELQASVLSRNGAVLRRRRSISLEVRLELSCANFETDAYVFTFLDYDGSVQYAAARAPIGARTAAEQSCPTTGCAVLFATHGAGVETDPKRNPAWAGAFRQQRQAWYTI